MFQKISNDIKNVWFKQNSLSYFLVKIFRTYSMKEVNPQDNLVPLPKASSLKKLPRGYFFNHFEKKNYKKIEPWIFWLKNKILTTRTVIFP